MSFFRRLRCISLEEKGYVCPKTFVHHKLCSKKKKSVVFHFLYDPVRDVVNIVLCILQNHYLLLRKSFRLVGHLLRKRQFKDAS